MVKKKRIKWPLRQISYACKSSSFHGQLCLLWWHPTPVLLPGKSYGQRSLVGCSSWGCEESDTTERLHFHFSLSCLGEGHGNPLQYSCLENPRDGGAWWAAVYGVAQSWTWLKRLSSSSSILLCSWLFTGWWKLQVWLLICLVSQQWRQWWQISMKVIHKSKFILG